MKKGCKILGKKFILGRVNIDIDHMIEKEGGD